jgi:NTP pyrophosphatase (non-canonical NTP hydrolase)
MEANKYQEMAMATKMPTCDNIIYMMGLLHEEAGELQGKLNKALRKGWILYDDTQLVWRGSQEDWATFREECIKELGDVCWAAAGVADVFQVLLADVMQGNLDKLADRKKRGVIIGEGDNR